VSTATQWTSAQEAEAQHWYALRKANDPESVKVATKLYTALGERGWEELREHIGDPDEIADARKTDEDTSDGATDGLKVPGGYPALLPWPPEDDGTVMFPGYDIDYRCVPNGARGQRRKRGELSMDRFWYKRKDGRRRFICRYKMTDRKGERHTVNMVDCAIARTLAERIYKNREEF
jgi:hypothetical protein